MGQAASNTTKGFPENFAKVPASKQCRRPPLIQDLLGKTTDAFPRCFDGINIKLRKRLPYCCELGGNLVLSSVFPSGGSIAGNHLAKKSNLTFSFSPYGAFAVNANKEFASGTYAAMLDSQVDLKHSSMLTTTFKYSEMQRCAALTLYGCRLPVSDIYTSFYNVSSDGGSNKLLGTVGLQYVGRVTQNTTLGMEIVYRSNVKLMIHQQIGENRGNFGALIDMVGLQAWWCRNVMSGVQMGVLISNFWDKERESSAMLGFRWKLNSAVVRASGSFDGVLGSTLERTMHFDDDGHILIGLSALLNLRNDKFHLGFKIECSL